MQTIESSPRDEGYADEDITLSQLNLIDLAGSESSKTETTGLRRKEGSFINKSLLTLGTVNFLFSFFLSFHEGRKHCSPLSICLVSLQEVVLFFLYHAVFMDGDCNQYV
jgi:hypothetical protein